MATQGNAFIRVWLSVSQSVHEKHWISLYRAPDNIKHGTPMFLTSVVLWCPPYLSTTGGGGTVGKCAVRILLECFLVEHTSEIFLHFFYNSKKNPPSEIKLGFQNFWMFES